MTAKYLIGVDEAGRGPLAGPVAVGACLVRRAAAKSFEKDFAAIRDSKKLSPAQRDEWFAKIRSARKDRMLDYAVSLVSAKMIDEKGIAPAIRTGLRRSLRKLLARAGAKPQECRVFLDGSLYAPKEFLRQETIIKGDDKVKVISAAAVAAKVTRDRKMERYAREFPAYRFEIHKGYGTALHRRALLECGLSVIHRRSFCSSFLAKKE